MLADFLYWKTKRNAIFMFCKQPVKVGKQLISIVHFEFGVGEQLELELEKSIGSVTPTSKELPTKTLGVVIETLSGVVFEEPNKDLFESKEDTAFINCAIGSRYIKAFPLEDGIFIYPKPQLLAFSQMESLDVVTQQMSRFFDIKIKTKEQKKVNLSMCPHDNLKQIQEYVENTVNKDKKSAEAEENPAAHEEK
eukprot:UN29263